MSFRYQEAQAVLSRLESNLADSNALVARAASVLCTIHDRDGEVHSVVLLQLKDAVRQNDAARRCLDEYSRATISALAPEVGVKP